MITNWKYRTLEGLENNYWKDIEFPTGLVERVHRLRKKVLTDLSPAELGVLIRQNEGLQYVVTLALEVLQNNPLVEGDYYEGDLFQNVMDLPEEFWKAHPDLLYQMGQLAETKQQLLDEHGLKTKAFLGYYNQHKSARP